jgi:putative zinc finger/helix-turn-helix YgiT family protein
MKTKMKGDIGMNTGNLIRKIKIECPLCGKVHDVEERTRIAKIIIKGERVDYVENYYFCSNCDDGENEFTNGKMENENLLRARNAYRTEHDLLTSDGIIAIRENYGLSQVDLAKLLGWGEATISRYESKAIQDDAYDNMLRIIKDNPLITLEMLQKNGEQFTENKKQSIKQKIMESLDEDGREYLQRQSLESEYVNYQEPCDANGYKLLDIDKLEAVVSYFAKRVHNLYKVKLMKMLWYADSLSFKRRGVSMMGLVYSHEPMGALPIGHYKIVGLENIKMQEEEGYENTAYHFLPNDAIDTSCLSDEDIDILDKVVDKFDSFTAKEIVQYMHEEMAYTKTKDKEIIPFSLAKEIKEF